MIVSSTEVQNNFGKYLMLAAKEEIIITRNGTVVAKLSPVLHPNSDHESASMSVKEGTAEYHYDGRKASYEEFLKLTEGTEDRYEYIDGEIYYLASPKTAHQVALTELLVLFYNFFQGSKCAPFAAPYDITLLRNDENVNIVQPDLMVICDLEEFLNEQDYYMGVPRLVVEILSESTRRKDLIKKLDLYMSCGVEEYWIVNPINQEVTIYAFKDRNIDQSATFRKSEPAHSFVFEGLSVELSRVFK